MRSWGSQCIFLSVQGRMRADGCRFFAGPDVQGLRGAVQTFRGAWRPRAPRIFMWARTSKALGVPSRHSVAPGGPGRRGFFCGPGRPRPGGASAAPGGPSVPQASFYFLTARTSKAKRGPTRNSNVTVKKFKPCKFTGIIFSTVTFEFLVGPDVQGPGGGRQEIPRRLAARAPRIFLWARTSKARGVPSRNSAAPGGPRRRGFLDFFVGPDVQGPGGAVQKFCGAWRPQAPRIFFLGPDVQESRRAVHFHGAWRLWAPRISCWPVRPRSGGRSPHITDRHGAHSRLAVPDCEAV